MSNTPLYRTPKAVRLQVTHLICPHTGPRTHARVSLLVKILFEKRLLTPYPPPKRAMSNAPLFLTPNAVSLQTAHTIFFSHTASYAHAMCTCKPPHATLEMTGCLFVCLPVCLSQKILSGPLFRNCLTDLYQIFRDDRRSRREAFDRV